MGTEFCEDADGERLVTDAAVGELDVVDVIAVTTGELERTAVGEFDAIDIETGEVEGDADGSLVGGGVVGKGVDVVGGDDELNP